MVPTRERNVSGVFLENHGDCYLLDCGEGTQRQMNIAGINRHRVDTVLVSHWHGDHVSGLMGLLQTKGKVPDPDPVTIVGPPGSEDRVEHLLETCYFNISYDLSVVEVAEGGECFVGDETVVRARRLDHGVPCLGYRVEERTRRRVRMDLLREAGVEEGPHIGRLQSGESIEVDGEVFSPDDYTFVPNPECFAYVVDTRPCENAVRLASGVDVLIAESTFDSSLSERAEEYKHLTASEAGRLAEEAACDELILTHFSQRFRDTQHLMEEASDVFRGGVRAARDFLEVDVGVAEDKGSS